MVLKKLIGVNTTGRRIGEDHHNAKICDHDVALLLDLRIEDPKRWSYRALGVKFEISKSQARNIIKAKWRGQQVARFKTIVVTPKRRTSRRQRPGQKRARK